MSNANIFRVFENIRPRTTVYTPLFEIIVNAIQAIEDKNIKDDRIDIVVKRSNQEEMDNGIGFTDKNRDSFDRFRSVWGKALISCGFSRGRIQ